MLAKILRDGQKNKTNVKKKKSTREREKQGTQREQRVGIEGNRENRAGDLVCDISVTVLGTVKAICVRVLFYSLFPVMPRLITANNTAHYCSFPRTRAHTHILKYNAVHYWICVIVSYTNTQDQLKHCQTEKGKSAVRTARPV